MWLVWYCGNSHIRYNTIPVMAVCRLSMIFSLSPGCGVKCRESPLEMVFVIDSSESVGPDNFNVVKDFVNALVDRASVSRETTRVGVVLYSHIDMVVVSLHQQASRDQVKTISVLYFSKLY